MSKYLLFILLIFLSLNLFSSNCDVIFQVHGQWGKFLGKWVLLPHHDQQRIKTCKKDWLFNKETRQVWHQLRQEYLLSCIWYRGKKLAMFKPSYLSVDFYYLEDIKGRKATCMDRGRKQ